MPQTITNSPPTETARATTPSLWPIPHVAILLGLWMFLFVAALFMPPLLDDADSTHAQAAQAMLTTHDWVTLHVDGIRYLEKPPLPYWIAAFSLQVFAPPATTLTADLSSAEFAAFAIHLPLALTILGLALLGYVWSRRAFPSPNGDQLVALYTALFILTSTGVFLFTRVFIPDALLSLLLAFALYALLRALERERTFQPDTRFPIQLWPYAMWLALALAVLTKGLVSLVFFFGTALLFLALTHQLDRWRRLRPFAGVLLFLAIAAPWHILAGLRNTDAADGHGFFWFYFVNEHVLRFLGRRIPRDYNKLPAVLYWSLHLVWLFPWSLFAPAALVYAWRRRREFFHFPKVVSSRPEAEGRSGETRSSLTSALTFRHQTILILLLFSAFVLLFFSISTNQEYYTFPIYLPLLMLLAASLTSIERDSPDPVLRRALTFAFAAFTFIGLAVVVALAYGLYTSRHLPFVPDIGELLAHRNVGGYTLSMSHFFDLTGPSFAALRLPAVLALVAFLFGPPLAWFLHTRRRFLPAILAVAFTSALFLFAAHIALVRFSPMLSSAAFARTIHTLQRNHSIAPDTEILLYGDQAFGSSIPFYLAQTSGHPNQHALLVDGRSTSMLFGSTFPDAPPIFLTSAQLVSQWGTGPRKLLFVPPEQRNTVDHLLGSRQIVLQQTSGKALITDRPL